jgi:hypothetical protein
VLLKVVTASLYGVQGMEMQNFGRESKQSAGRVKREVRRRNPEE